MNNSFFESWIWTNLSAEWNVEIAAYLLQKINYIKVI